MKDHSIHKPATHNLHALPVITSMAVARLTVARLPVARLYAAPGRPRLRAFCFRLHRLRRLPKRRPTTDSQTNQRHQQRDNNPYFKSLHPVRPTSSDPEPQPTRASLLAVNYCSFSTIPPPFSEEARAFTS
jgi:hypothetical protein